MAYIVYINTEDNVSEIALPQVDNRVMHLDFSKISEGLALSMSVFDGVWTIHKDYGYTLVDNGITVQSKDIADGSLVYIVISDRLGGEQALALMVKEVKSNENSYSKYLLDKSEITVGNGDYDICVEDQFMSGSARAHCIIRRSGKHVILEDMNSRNGTFVNGLRVTNTELKVFDTVYCAGHKFIFLGNTIAINDSDKNISTTLTKADLAFRKGSIPADAPFSRSPRRIAPLATDTVQIEAPPQKQRMNQQPLIFVVGPSVTMPIPIMLSVLVNTLMSGNSENMGLRMATSVISVLASSAIGAGWALAHMKYNKKQINEGEEKRVDTYNKYIEDTTKQLEDKTVTARKTLSDNYPSSSDFIYEIDENILWNRNMYQSDFLTIRLGYGNIDLPGGINISNVKKSQAADDELINKPQELYDKFSVMNNSIFTLSVIRHKVIGVVGDDISYIVNNIVIQLTAYHSYNDLRLALLGDTSDMVLYSWLKWLPHIRSGEDQRSLGFDEQGRENVAYSIASNISARLERSEKEMLLPHIVVIATDPKFVMQSRLVNIMNSPAYMGITFILLSKSISLLPNVCKAIIENTHEFSGFYMLDEAIDEKNKIKFDMVESSKAEIYARNVSCFYVPVTSSGSIPSAVDYFDLIRIGKPEHWDLLRRYKENRSFEGLRSLIGVGSSGQELYLDIHDKKHGPHGLVAGTTGSGKSETLQTFILSLAMNYSPDEVSFILIDYKGGGMANVFDGLPHVAGMLTNLSDSGDGSGDEIDPEITRRVCDTLRSEIKRRQRIFGQNSINHIDSYIRLYRENEVKEPLPHLVIISDEFAELKKEQPEFIKELVSVARVGRSLGVHLILATQKPTGVVDDEIWSNSRFRLCLRVQDKQDSQGMLKTPDAAYITEAGRGYMQVGTDEVYEMFQTAYSGGEYIPKERPAPAEDNIVKMIELDGSPSVVKKRSAQSSKETELHVLVEFIGKTCQEGGISPARSLWLPPLPSKLYLEDIHDSVTGRYTASYGIADDFEGQRQFVTSLSLDKCRNIKIVGTPGSGKTTVIQTIIMSLIGKVSPSELNIYIMDFSSRTFKAFEKLPHVGGVIFEENAEGVEKTLMLIRREINERKLRFEEAGAGGFDDYSKRFDDTPLTLLIIDNASLFGNEGVYQNYADALLSILKDGIRYGIQTIVTVNNMRELSYKMRSYIYDSIALQLTDRGDYSEIIKINPPKLCRSVPGRGYINTNGGLYEFQTLLPHYGITDSERLERMTAIFEEIAGKYDQRAKQVPLIPVNKTYRDIAAGFETKKLLIGYEYTTAQEYSIAFSDFYCFVVSGGVRSLSQTLSNIAYYGELNNFRVDIIKLRNAVKIDIPQNSQVYNSAERVHDLMSDLQKDFAERNKEVGVWKNSDKTVSRYDHISGKFDERFIIIDDIKELCSLLEEHPADRNDRGLFEMFVKSGAEHGIHMFAGFDPTAQSYSSVAKLFRSDNCGIHLGTNGAVQTALEFDIQPSVISKLAKINVGYSVIKNRTAKVYVPGLVLQGGEDT